MSLIPRLYDDFSTDPTSDPLYNMQGVGPSGSIFYDSALDRVRVQGKSSFIEVLNSANPYGIVELDLLFSPDSIGSGKTCMRVFGYNFVLFFNNTQIYAEDTVDSWFAAGSVGGPVSFINQNSYHKSLNETFLNTQRVYKFVSTPFGVTFYVDDVLKASLPAKPKVSNIRIFNGAAEETQRFYLYSISIKADSSAPKSPQILEPAEAGSINAAQEVICTVPESRLFVDLGSYAPSITGLTNVVYDPGGANVSMSEDTGIPTRLGGTTGDYYLEIPSNGVAQDYRLVIKEDFVTANSVVVTDTIDFDVSPSPSGQTGSVVEEDDLHCYLNQVFSVDSPNAEVALHRIGVIPHLHNVNADGNTTNYVLSAPASIFDRSTGEIVAVSSGVSFPILLDVDLGAEYEIRRFNSVVNSDFGNSYVTAMDIYSNTVPFSGSSLAQGTLEETAYAVTGQPGATNLSVIADQIPRGSGVNFTTRYLRFVFLNSGYFNVGLGATNLLPNVIEITVTDFKSINSDDDNAQFEFSNGGAFGAYSAGGETQGSGYVRITLPTNMQIPTGQRRFISIQFKADLTD